MLNFKHIVIVIFCFSLLFSFSANIYCCCQSEKISVISSGCCSSSADSNCLQLCRGCNGLTDCQFRSSKQNAISSKPPEPYQIKFLKALVPVRLSLLHRNERGRTIVKSYPVAHNQQQAKLCVWRE